MIDAYDPNLSPEAALSLAVERIGSQTEFAKICGKTQGAVSKRLAAGKPAWPESALKVEAASRVSRHNLRPDLYPLPSSARDPLGQPSPASPTSAGGGPTPALDTALAGVRS